MGGHRATKAGPEDRGVPLPAWDTPIASGSSEQDLRERGSRSRPQSRLGACSPPAQGLSILNGLWSLLLGAGPWASNAGQRGCPPKDRAWSQRKGWDKGRGRPTLNKRGTKLHNRTVGEGWPWVVSCLSSGAFKPGRVSSCQERPRQCSGQGARQPSALNP